MTYNEGKAPAKQGGEIWTLESDHLSVGVTPSVGGRIVSIFNNECGYEFLWRNKSVKLERLEAGADYDGNFYGGIDELMPNDIPENIGGTLLPDHGELWTMSLESTVKDGMLRMWGRLPVYGLDYNKTVSVRPDASYVDIAYCVRNPTNVVKPFLWKLHAALRIGEGDVIICPARTARAVDPGWSRWRNMNPFEWPSIDGQRADLIPAPSSEVDFLYLYDLFDGKMGWRSASSTLEFTLEFDRNVFPYCWLFGSYGGFNGHYTAILEPCTTMPMSLNEAQRLGQCSTLDPGQEMKACVSIFAGRTRCSTWSAIDENTDFTAEQ